jgi:RNA polymerase sigma-70 factor (ECF subfamily)
MAKADDLYEETIAAFGPALERLARGYEADPEKRRDLLQEIHVSLWRSFETFDHRCSLRTWVYRVAHNRAASHVRRSVWKEPSTVSLDELKAIPENFNGDVAVDRTRALERLLAMVHRLPDIDCAVILLHLEGMDTAAIAEVVGLSPSNVGTKVHRLKKVLINAVRSGVKNV